jgi:competence protein ComGC
MAKGFVRTINEMVNNKEKEIWINWVNTPEHLYKKNPNFVPEMRKMLLDNGYVRESEHNMAQETYIYKGGK